MDIGNLFIVGFEGTSLTKDLREKLLRVKPAGIIFYDTNIKDREQVKKLIQDLKDLLGEDLIVTTDQEGGKVERLRRVCTSMPSLWALGSAAGLVSDDISKQHKINKNFVANHARVLATEMLDLGFNLVLGPCVDLCTNLSNPIIGSRSLGQDPRRVSEAVKIIIETYSECGLKSCAKHFPGHGNTDLDSHTDLPVVYYQDLNKKITDFKNKILIENFQNKSQITDLYENHLEPFKAAIAADVSSIMISHIALPQIEMLNSKTENASKEVNYESSFVIPASMSANIIQKELKDKLKYKGIVIGDEMTMKAVAALGDYGEISEKVIEAGCDLLTWNTNLDEPLRAIEYLEKAAKKSNHLKNRIQESNKRIEDFRKNNSKKISKENKKNSQNINQQKSNSILSEKDFKEHEKLMLEIVGVAMKNSKPCGLEVQSLTGFDKSNTLILAFKHPKLEIDQIEKASGLNVIGFSGDENPHDFTEQIKKYQNIIVLSFQTSNFPLQAKFVKNLKAKVIQESDDNDQNHKNKAKKFSIIQCSTDLHDAGAEIDLFGANKVHIMALLKVLHG